MPSSHPSYDIRGSESNELAGKRIALCISGSVAAVRGPEIARSLMRAGADVVAVMSENAKGLIHPNLMHWATGNPVIHELTGAIEHVALAGSGEARADLVLVAPATANTVSKIACGIDDTPVTTVVTTGLGAGIPLVVVPAMHAQMYHNPFVRANLRRLEEGGVTLVLPRMEEGKAKVAETREILLAVTRRLSASSPLSGKRLLITAGRTVEYLDPIRVLTNNSSGKMGMALARAGLSTGAEVTVVYGRGTASVPPSAHVVRVEDADDMKRAVWEELGSKSYDAVIAAAAVGDWKPRESLHTKAPTAGGSWSLELVPTPKIIDEIKVSFPKVFLLAFRAVHGLSDDEMIEDAYRRLQRAQADLIAANDVGQEGAGFESETNRMVVVDRDKQVERIPLASKDTVARRLLEALATRLVRKPE